MQSIIGSKGQLFATSLSCDYHVIIMGLSREQRMAIVQGLTFARECFPNTRLEGEKCVHLCKTVKFIACNVMSKLLAVLFECQ